MLRNDIITEWRKLMADNVGATDAERLWDKAEASSLFNDACDALCEATRYFTGAMVDAVCLIPLVAGTRFYRLHGAVLSVESVRPSWQTTPLSKMDVDTIDSHAPGWLTNTGRPKSWLLDYEPGYLTLSHEPLDAGDSLRLTVVRRQVDNSLATLEIPAQWHKHLKLYMAYAALLKQDSEVAGAGRLSDFKGLWDGAVETMKRDILKMRRSSVNLSFVG